MVLASIYLLRREKKVENNTTKSRGSLKALFLIPSIIVVILFLSLIHI